MVVVTDVDLDAARSLGMARQDIHDRHGNGSERSYSDRYRQDVDGVCAELAFSDLTGLPMPQVLDHHGDGGHDFAFAYHGKHLTINVKGSSAPRGHHLFLKTCEASRCADIFVKARVMCGGSAVAFLGWESKAALLAAPVRHFGLIEYGRKIHNHYIHYLDLQPMQILLDLISVRDAQLQ